ncbi:MAG: site-specific integrase, partial [Acidimicrobiales bacterium]
MAVGDQDRGGSARPRAGLVERPDEDVELAAARERWLLDDFGDWLLSRSRATRRAYLGDMAGFCEWAGRAGCAAPADADRVLLRRYLAYLSTRGYARASVARKAAALRAYFDWCRRRG